eukprot:TRINITY_DN90_c0_g1_i4.p1 TRINITY_DN90_c0_g1~~TRINITY_DN90_c0_g1_i4.p1  ORF type:complete len:315 (+),score=75.85 TRINITY_DN90_c0_g1_i4:3-947(+)
MIRRPPRSTPIKSSAASDVYKRQVSMSSEQTNNKDAETEDESSPPQEEVKPAITSVKDFGVSCDQNWKHRRKMEDAHTIIDGFLSDPNKGFFAVFDGHGGKEAAVFASKNFHVVLEEFLSKENEEVYNDQDKVFDILKKVYHETDERIKTAVPTHHGSTAVTCLITGKGDNRHLYTGNAGDARAVLCRDGKAIRLTYEHKAADESEAARITQSGGFIIHGRVNGQIIITRSLGDHLMKDYIISEPYTTHEKLTEKDTHLIVACDGLWDVVEDQQACDFLAQYPNSSADELSKRLLVKALQEGSTDNLSICVVKL